MARQPRALRLMDMPPTRYRVIERGRRLVVVDTRTGAQTGTQPAPESPARQSPSGRAPAPSALAPPAAPAAAPDEVFTTAAWYDARGPRRIRKNFAVRSQLQTAGMVLAIAGATAAILAYFFWPWFLFGAVVLLGSKKARTRLRAGAAGFLDSIDPDRDQAG